MRNTRGHLTAALLGFIAGAIIVTATTSARNLDTELALEIVAAMRSARNLQLIKEGKYAAVERQAAGELQIAIARARRLTDRGADLNREDIAVRDLRSLIPLVDRSVAAAGLPDGVAQDFRAVARAGLN